MGRRLKFMAVDRYAYEDDEGPDPDGNSIPIKDDPEFSNYGRNRKSRLNLTIPGKKVVDAYERARRSRHYALHGEETKYTVRDPESPEYKGQPTPFYMQRLAEILTDTDVDARTFMPRRFALQPRQMIYPNMLLSFTNKWTQLKGKELVVKLSKSTRVRQYLEIELRTQRSRVELELTLADCADDVLLDGTVDISPLFRYLFAKALGREEVAGLFYFDACEQYASAKLDYDAAWGSIIDKKTSRILTDG